MLETYVVSMFPKHRFGFQHLAQSLQNNYPTHVFSIFRQCPKHTLVQGIVMYKPSRTATASELLVSSTPWLLDSLTPRHFFACFKICDPQKMLRADGARGQNDPVLCSIKRDACEDCLSHVQADRHLGITPCNRRWGQDFSQVQNDHTPGHQPHKDNSTRCIQNGFNSTHQAPMPISGLDALC
jgi:hypothetical protein